jgi:hypothetical protein
MRGAMIQMSVGMRHQEWKLFVVLTRQEFQDCFRQWHLLRIGDRTGVDQKRLI